MLTIIAFCGSRTATGQVLATAAQLLASAWRRFLAWQARRATRTILASLDDRTLHDIGLHRGEIESAVRDLEAGLARRASRRASAASGYGQGLTSRNSIEVISPLTTKSP
jgi:uncharacterized protein YjiS (DUF1127 family)